MRFLGSLRGIHSLCLTTLLTVALVACGATQETEHSKDDRLASSISELAQTFLDNDGGEAALSASERAALTKVVETGIVEQADYEDAINGYLTCLRERGFELEVTYHASGVVEDQPTANDSAKFTAEEQMAATYECGKDTTYLVTLYNLQQGNPKLYTDPHQAMLECLEDSGLLQTGEYTAEELADKLKTRNGFRDLPFNVNEPGPQNCFYSAGLAIKVDY